MYKDRYALESINGYREYEKIGKVNNKPGILIIGKTPPPIGGVSVHIDRLLCGLRRDNIPFENMSISRGSLRAFAEKYFKSEVIHLNISNVYARTLITLISFLTGKKHINTFHGNLGNKGPLQNFFDVISIRLSTRPVVLNDGAEKFACRYNKRTVKISAFIPPEADEALPERIISGIEELSDNYKTIYCTNAFGLEYNSKRDEIYGISQLISIFTSLSTRALILSDPSGSYSNHFKRNNIKLPTNIMLISEPHSFMEVLKRSDCYIRNTTTDGDSLSVREALYLRKPVIATSCVQRPEGVVLCEVNNSADLRQKIEDLDLRIHSLPESSDVNGYLELRKIYQELISK